VPLNRDYIGRAADPDEPLEVTRGDIRRFATAIGDDNPVCHDVEAAKAAGHRDLVAPPTFLITAATAGGGGGIIHEPGLGLDYAMVVHGEQRFEFNRPVYAGDVLVTVTSIADIRAAGRNELMTLVSVVTTTSGEPVATVTNTIVSRGTAAPKED
jgi:acyl dehydratase